MQEFHDKAQSKFATSINDLLVASDQISVMWDDHINLIDDSRYTSGQVNDALSKLVSLQEQLTQTIIDCEALLSAKELIELFKENG